ncbi:succinate dehydrogenase, cytochrome b556 subunit [Zavarzinia sp. CC-PAN008]|uniref:succinate dehydrogenase, cytochrome b556 subunit n=1 Tax=Zavarzinia sp. CC-PAN008 TaxID=3243332 RepID=UPI003F749163
MAGVQRPRAPHLQVYRPQISSVLSIFHRMTGCALGVGTLLLAWWLLAAATGPEAFATAQGFFGSWFGRLVLFGFTWALSYHFLNGIRHLFWDAGLGFELSTMAKSGWAVLVGSVAITLALWVLGYAMAAPQGVPA